MSWRPIKGWEGKYVVNALGEIRNIQRGNAVNGFTLNSGHQCVRFYISSHSKNGKRYQKHAAKTIGSIVAQAFLGDRPDFHILRWLNGDRADNRVENLRYTKLAKVRPTQNAWSRYRLPKWTPRT